jgi:hypothetical protein
MGDPKRGLYGKFIIERVDGSDAPGRKHDGCDYFVLDLTHDKHALAAIYGYIESCQDEYPILAADLERKAALRAAADAEEAKGGPDAGG